MCSKIHENKLILAMFYTITMKFKKLLPFLIGAGVLVAGTAFATIYQPYQGGTGIGSATSGQVGYNLQVSTTSPFLGFTLAPTAASATTTINGVSGPTFTFSIVSTSSASSITTTTAQLFLNLLQYTSGTNISVAANGVINFSGVLPITSGGTNATSAAAALTQLGAQAALSFPLSTANGGAGGAGFYGGGGGDVIPGSGVAGAGGGGSSYFASLITSTSTALSSNGGVSTGGNAPSGGNGTIIITYSTSTLPFTARRKIMLIN